MRLDQALNRVWQMLITRLKAVGEKWRIWHRINANSGKPSFFPRKFQDRRIIKFNDVAEYTIHPLIFRAYTVTLQAMRGARPVTLAKNKRSTKPKPRTAGAKRGPHGPDPTHDAQNGQAPPSQNTDDTPQGTTCTWYICKVGTKRCRPPRTDDGPRQRKLGPSQHQSTPFSGIGPATQSSMTDFFSADT